MTTYLVLLRGINVGGKNIVPMSRLKSSLEQLGFASVSTYSTTGNVFLESDTRPNEIKARIEAALTKSFKLEGERIKALVLSRKQLRAVIDNRPEGFGDQPGKYHSDAILLIDIDAAQAMPAFNPREGVDKVWPGKSVIYSQRLSALRTKSRLNQAMGAPVYKCMTIRSWSTTGKLLEALNNRGAAKEG